MKKTFLLVSMMFVLLFSSLSAQAASFSKKAPAVTAKRSGTSVTLSWKRRSSLTGYKIYKTNASGKNRKLIKTVRGASVTFRSLKRGKTYYYRVRGYQKKSGRIKYTSFSKVIKVRVLKETRTSTLKKFLQTALQPAGSTMYVWGGGWNKADTGAGREARTIGVSPAWKKFFNRQTKNYNYQTTRYQISNGLDCSGYVGWCIYNILNTKNGKTGYVMKADKMAKNFASRGWGSYTPASRVRNYRAGDIMSSSGHVWIAVGQCSDGSVVLLHSSPPGVQLSGTPSKSGKKNSKAVKLASSYMKKYYPKWYQKYPDCSRGASYLHDYGQMRWDISGNAIMTDPDRYRNMSAEQILKDLFQS